MYQPMLDNELIVDNFAGGGGASCGIEEALQRPVNIAINHDKVAIGMHAKNHPLTDHHCEDVWQVNPREVTKGRPVLLAWFSPDCKHHSKARGQKPVNKNIRGLAWVALRWAATVQPRIIMLENVEEFQDWGPVVHARDEKGHLRYNSDGSKIMMPDADRRGITFRSFVNALKRNGYHVEWREQRACDYGAPTIRKRLFLIARRDGLPIVWPKPSHAKKPNTAQKLYKTAADCIDWSIPCPSIFDRKRELAENTQRRIAKGLEKFVLTSADPFIVKVNHTASYYEHFRGQSIHEPLGTTTQKNGFGLAQPTLAPFITEHANGSNQRNMPMQEPLRTQCAEIKGGHFAAVAPVLVGVGGRAGQSGPRSGAEPTGTTTAKADTALMLPTLIEIGYGEAKGQEPRAPGLDKPLGTPVASSVKHAIAAAHIMKFRHDSGGSDMKAPLPTVTAGSFIKRPGGAGHALGVCTAYITKMRGENVGHPADESLHTVSAGGQHHALSMPFMVKYYGSGDGKDPHTLDKPLGAVTTKDRFGLVDTALQFPPLDDAQLARARQVAALMRRFGYWDDREFVTVTIQGIEWIVVDIGMRMLAPRELARAQGFPDSYIIDRTIIWDEAKGEFVERQLTKTEQVRMIGNSVSPEHAKALVLANVPRWAIQPAAAVGA